MSRSLHQLVAMTNKNRVTRIPSRTCSTCHNDVICQYTNQDGTLTTMNPVCSILGPTLCKNCSLMINRQQRIMDTKRILGKFSEPMKKRNIKEQALLSKMKEQLLEEERVDCSRYGNQIGTANSFQDGGYTARNNTPDNLYLTSRRSINRRRNQQSTNSSFCQKPIRDTLQNLTMKMADRYLLKGVGNKNKHLFGGDMTSHSSAKAKIFLPDLIEDEINFSSQSSIESDNLMIQSNYANEKENQRSYINGDELRQKLESVYEQRHLPPINFDRRESTTSSVDDADEIDGEHSLITTVKSEANSPNDEITHCEKSDEKIPEKSDSILIPKMSPVLLDAYSQMSRREMFSNIDEVIPNDGKSIKVDQHNVHLLRLIRPLKKK